MKKIVIFLNGQYSKSILNVKTVSSRGGAGSSRSSMDPDDNTIIFAADNGFQKVLKQNFKYSKLYLFGDFDSLSPYHLKKAKKEKNIILNILPKKKNVSDFGCILDNILRHFSHKHPFFIEIYGGLGKAKDHEYANLKEAEHFLAQSKFGGIIVFQGNVILSTASFAITHIRKKNFSIFCSPNCNFSIQNALYSGNFSLTRPSHGLSNAIKKSPLMVERTSSKEIMTLIIR